MAIHLFNYIAEKLAIFLNEWESHSSFLVFGQSRIGKSTFVKAHLNNVKNENQYVLELGGSKEYQGAYAPFQLALLGLQNDSYYAKQVGKSAIGEFSKETRLPIKTLVDVFFSHNEIRRNIKLPTMNDIEKKIISHINMATKNKKLIVLIEDYQYWDEKSQSLLAFLMTEQAKSLLSFLAEAKFILISSYRPKSIRCSFEFELSPCSSYEDFVLQLEEDTCGSSKSAYEIIYAITGGNLGQARVIIDILDLSNFGVKSEQNVLDSLNSDILYRVFEERVKVITQISPKFTSAMESASVLGERFEVVLLNKLYDTSDYSLFDNLTLADQYKIVRKCTKISNEYEFYNAMIHAFFYAMPDNRKKEYHYRFSQLFAQLRPFDYYKRYYHLYHADVTEKAFEMLAIHLIRQRQKGLPIATEHGDLIKHAGGKFYEAYHSINQALSAKTFEDAKKPLSYLDASLGILTLFERDYTYAMMVSTKSVYSNYKEVYLMLEKYFHELKEEYFEHWVRFGMFFMIFCVNRICDVQKSQEIERILMFELGKKCQEDSYWEIPIHMINRNSGAIYNIEIALVKTKRSYDFFLSRINERPENYILAASNYSGALILGSEFQKAFEYAKLCIYELKDRSLFIDRIEKLFNNYVVSGFLAGELTGWESVQLLESILGSDGFEKYPLIANNYHLASAYSGKLEDALAFFSRMHKCDRINNHNDYYRYLYNANYLSLLILSNQYSEASDIYNELDMLVPAIFMSEQVALINRYRAYEHIILEMRVYSSISELSNAFKELCSDNPPFFNGPFFFSDQQFWTTI